MYTLKFYSYLNGSPLLNILLKYVNPQNCHKSCADYSFYQITWLLSLLYFQILPAYTRYVVGD